MSRSYANGPSAQPLLGETIGENLERTAARFPDRLALVSRHPDVSDVQVIGVPDQKYGEELMARVKVREGATLTEGDLKEFCRGRIAHYKVPRYVRFTDGFPMTVTGKIQKFKMREQAIAELGLEAAAGMRTA